MTDDTSSLAPGPVRVGPPLSRRRTYEARIATDDQTRRDAFRLRYESYRARGHIVSNPTNLFCDEYDSLPSARTIVVYSDGLAIGSVRVCLLRRDAGMTSPAFAAYPDEVGAILAEADPQGEGHACVEMNRLVRAPQSADDQGLVFMLIRLAGRLALAEDAQASISCVRTHHLPFYRRLHYTQAGPARPYPGLTCDMVLLRISRPVWDQARGKFRLIDPDAGPVGLLAGLERGQTVFPDIIRR